MEALSLTGVAKALLAFYKTARTAGWADTSLATYVRRGADGTLPPVNTFVQAMEALQFPVARIPEKNAFDPGALIGLRRLLRESQPDIVETHAVKSHVLMRVLTSLFRPATARWVAFHHGYTTPDRKMKLYNRLNPWALRGADLVVTVCQPFAEQLSREGVPRERIHVLPNAIEPFTLPSRESAAALRDSLEISAGAFVFVSIGRLSSEKGHCYLVDAASQLQQKSFAVVLVGDGPERESLEKQVASLGLRAHVKFTGHQSDPLPYYGITDAFVLPSLSEGSPLVLLEAMVAQVPVIASQVGGIPETVSNERSALLVPPRDTVRLAAAMTRVLRDDSLRETLQQNAFADVTTKHAPAAYAAAVMNLYRGLLAR